MAGEVCNWRLVETSSRVYVDGVDDFVSALATICRGMYGFELSRRSEKQTTIRGECQSSKEGRESLVGVDIRVAYA